MDSDIFWNAWHDLVDAPQSSVTALAARLAAAVFPPPDGRPAEARAEIVAETGRRYQAAVADPATAAGVSADSGTTLEMVAQAAEILFAPMTPDALLVQWALVPSATPRPMVIFHVPAGNVYVSGLEYLALTAFIGASGIVRIPRRGGAALRLWLRLLHEVDPAGQAGRWVAARWPRDAAAAPVTAAAVARADVVVAMGSDATLAALAPAVPAGARFVRHGSRASLMVLGPGSAPGCYQKHSIEEVMDLGDLSFLAFQVAFDHVLHDQQGCLSPRAVVLMGWTAKAAGLFSAKVSEAMERLTVQLPRAALSLAESAALARRRDETVLAAVLGDPCHVVSPSGAPYLVTLAPAESFAGPGPANRYVEILHAPDGGSAVPGNIHAAFAGHVSTLAVAGFDPSMTATLARDLGATRTCAPGTMQSPPPGWCHDGNTGLGWLMGINLPSTPE